MALKRCPCGEIPTILNIANDSGGKYCFVTGNCCDEWHIEYRNNYHDVLSNKCHELAESAWNNAPRENDEKFGSIQEDTKKPQ